MSNSLSSLNVHSRGLYLMLSLQERDTSLRILVLLRDEVDFEIATRCIMKPF